MLGIELLDLSLLLADADILEATINDLMGRGQVQQLIESNQGIRGLVQTQFMSWKNKLTDKVEENLIEQGFSGELDLYQEVVYWEEEAFLQNLEHLKETLLPKTSFYHEGVKILEQEDAKYNPMLGHYFCQQWYQHLVSKIEFAQKEMIDKEQAQEIEQLYQKLEHLSQIQTIESASANHSILARLWDMSFASLSKKDWQLMAEQAQFLKKHPQLVEIAEHLGRAGQTSSNESDDGIKPQESISLPAQGVDQMVGIHQGDDLNKLLPNEVLFLAYPELEIVFYQHLVEKRLQNYQMQSQETKRLSVQELKQKIEGDEKKGPFILCLDASGSMKGEPEHMAKAVAFALTQIALAQSRDCFVILFSTDQITYELTRQDGLREMSDFLSYSFHGGTAFDRAVEVALKEMEKKKFNNADLLMISDFIGPNFSLELQDKVARLKVQKNRFYGMSVSKYANADLLSIFDQYWQYFGGLKQTFVLKRP